MTHVTGAEFNRHPSRVRRAASEGPVVITEHGRPAHVLLSFDEFERLRGRRDLPDDVAGWLRMDSGDSEIDFDPEPLRLGLRAADL